MFITARIAFIHVFNRSSNIWLPYIHNRLFTTSRVYLEPTQWPTSSRLVSSVGRAPHRYRRGHGFKSRTGLIFFFRPYFHHCLSTVHYCEGHFHIHAFIRSSNIWPSYIHSRLYIWSSQTSTYIYTIHLSLSIYLLSINIEVWRVKSISSSLGKSEGRSPQPHR